MTADTDHAAYRALWCAVVHAACMDWAHARKLGEDHRHPDVRYIDGAAFERVCGLAGMDPEAVRNRLQSDPEIIDRLTRRKKQRGAA